jgi:hypothetical protein
MFSPFKVANFQEKIVSLYKAAAPLNAGALVDIDPTDASAISGSVGFNTLTGGTVKLATVATASATSYGRILGVAIPTVSLTGPTLQERILELASSYMTVPVGAAVAVFEPAPGDIIATTEYVGYLAGDSSATGFLDTTNAANMAKPVAAFGGRFRLVQGGDAVIARYVGNTTVNGALVGLFQFA